MLRGSISARCATRITILCVSLATCMLFTGFGAGSDDKPGADGGVEQTPPQRAIDREGDIEQLLIRDRSGNLNTAERLAGRHPCHYPELSTRSGGAGLADHSHPP